MAVTGRATNERALPAWGRAIVAAIAGGLIGFALAFEGGLPILPTMGVVSLAAALYARRG